LDKGGFGGGEIWVKREGWREKEIGVGVTKAHTQRGKALTSWDTAELSFVLESQEKWLSGRGGGVGVGGGVVGGGGLLGVLWGFVGLPQGRRFGLGFE